MRTIRALAIVIACSLQILATGCKPRLASADASERLRAVQAPELIDQALLTKVAVEDTDSQVALAALRRLTSQSALATIARSGALATVRQTAVACLTDQDRLEKLVADAPDSAVRLTAFDKLNTEPAMARIAISGYYHDDADVPSTAVAKLTNQDLLAKVVLEAKEYRISVAAVGRLANQDLLAKLAMEARDYRDYRISVAAVEELVDQDLLFRVVLKAKDDRIGIAAVGKLVDQDQLFILAFTSLTHLAVRRAALEHLTDQQLLAQKVVDGTVNSQDISRDVQNSNDQNSLAMIAVEHKDGAIRCEAARKLTDQAVMAKVAIEDKEFMVASAAMHSLIDYKLLAQVAMTANDPTIREYAQKRLTHRTLLAALTVEAKNSETCHKAILRVCSELVKQGDETRIPEMVNLLDLYGDRGLAEHYLNCGQPELQRAASSWANKNGFTTMPSQTLEIGRWGLGR